MTTPIKNERAATPHREKIYEAAVERAKLDDPAQSRRRVLRIVEGAATGIVFWLLLFTLGVPWVFHIGGLDGILPSAIICMGLALTRWHWVARAAVVTLALLLGIITYTPLTTTLTSSLTRNDPLPASADAIMVLSAGTNDEGRISPRGVDRLLSGLELVSRGIAPVLMVSREAYIVDGRIITSQADQERIVSAWRLPSSNLVVVGITHSTRDEAIRAREVIRMRGWKRIVVVTSPFHTRRACATFEKVGVVVSCAASASRDMAVKDLSAPDDRLKAFQVWLYETLGSLRYRQLGWI